MQQASELAAETPYPAAYARPEIRSHSPARRWWWVGGAAVLIVAGGLGASLLGAGWFGRDASGAALNYFSVEPTRLNITLTEDGELKPRESVEIKCKVEGQSTILFVVDESTQVKKGDLLVELASDDLIERLESEQMELRRIQAEYDSAVAELEIQLNQNQADIRKAEIDLEIAELDLRKYAEGDLPQSIKGCDLDIEKSRMDIKRREDELEKNLKLQERGFVTATKIEELQFGLETARMTLERQELAKKTLLEYEKPKMEMQKNSAVDQAREELERVKKRAASKAAQSQAQVDQYKDQVAKRERRVERLQEQIQYCKIYAPADGMVQYPDEGFRWGGGARISTGETVREGQSLLSLPDTSQMTVEMRIHEADRHRVHEGMRCVVKVPAVPGETFTGTISKIDRFADSENRWLNPDLKEHTTQVTLDPFDAPLSPGDSAEVKILIDEIASTLAVPVQCVYSRGSRSYVFEGASPVEVQLGRSTSNMVEIVSGVQSGAQVAMSADDKMLAALPAIGTGGPTPAGEGEPSLAEGASRGPAERARGQHAQGDRGQGRRGQGDAAGGPGDRRGGGRPRPEMAQGGGRDTGPGRPGGPQDADAKKPEPGADREPKVAEPGGRNEGAKPGTPESGQPTAADDEKVAAKPDAPAPSGAAAAEKPAGAP